MLYTTTLPNNVRKQVYQSYSLRNYLQLPQAGILSARQREAIEVVSQVLPFKTNNYVVNELIDWSNIPDDPFFTLTFPRAEMLSASHYREMKRVLDRGGSKEDIKEAADRIRLQLNPHPAGQQHNIPRLGEHTLTGMQHKYRETVLFFPSQGQTCHAYCSFCFRWPQFVGMDEMKFAMRETDLLKSYLLQHPEVTDLLFTGGDPMVMKARLFRNYVEPLLDPHLENLQTIRIGTKSLSYWPYKFISDEDAGETLRLMEAVVRSGRNLSIMAHINHPGELDTKAARQAITAILNTGAQIRTQSPVLKHINDDPATWARLWRNQVNLNLVPYYMFAVRDTGAQDFFGVPLVRAHQIFQQAYQQVSGVCRTVRGPSMSCTAGKIQVLGTTEVMGKKQIALQMIQGRNPDWVGRPFFAAYDDEALWIDQLQPAFGEEKFFYEEELDQLLHKEQAGA